MIRMIPSGIPGPHTTSRSIKRGDFHSPERSRLRLQNLRNLNVVLGGELLYTDSDFIMVLKTP